MAVVINGNGTVTGISVGGLPDGIVDTDMLAADAVTDAKQDLSGAAKVWINFDMNADSITSSFGVSSINDDGTGLFTITYSSAFSNTNYCILTGQACKTVDDSDNRYISRVRDRSTSDMQVEHNFIENGTSNRFDSRFMYFAVFA
tara:strand:- start:499 stop:933 length:435 start_codon:yes stop_codon:yes gene_type:complete